MESKKSKDVKKDTLSSTSVEDQLKRKISIHNETLIEGNNRLLKLSTRVDKIHCRIGTLESSFSEWKKKSTRNTQKLSEMGEGYKKELERIDKLSNLNSKSLDMVLKKEESNSTMYLRGISYIEQETKKQIESLERKNEDGISRFQASIEHKQKAIEAKFLSKIEVLKEESDHKIEISRKESESIFSIILEEIKLLKTNMSKLLKKQSKQSQNFKQIFNDLNETKTQISNDLNDIKTQISAIHTVCLGGS